MSNHFDRPVFDPRQYRPPQWLRNVLRAARRQDVCQLSPRPAAQPASVFAKRCRDAVLFGRNGNAAQRDEAAASNTPQQARLRPDWWQRAPVILTFLSSVVLAAVGIAITSSIQKTQIAATTANTHAQLELERARNHADKNIQETKLASDLMQHILKGDNRHRVFALELLRQSMPAESYTNLLVAIAKADSDPTFRKSAIKELGGATDKQTALALKHIVADPSRSTEERGLAAAATKSIAGHIQQQKNNEFLTFSSTISISPASPSKDQSIHIVVDITNTAEVPAHDLMVDVEVYTANNNKVFQNFFSTQDFDFGTTNRYDVTWQPSAAGQYRVKVGVFNRDWKTILYWRDPAQLINVAERAPDVVSAASIDVWWPTDGSAVHGIQALKAMIRTMPIAQYQLFWTVDGGAPNPMHNKQNPGNPDMNHKEAIVDFTGWTWSGTGRQTPYRITFIAKDQHSRQIASRTVTVYRPD
jgi:hypothetical protein